MADASRRNLLRGLAVGASAVALSGCKSVSQTQWVQGVLYSAEGLTRRVQRLFAGRDALATEYSKADIAPVFRTNGTLNPPTSEYQKHVAEGFANWRVVVNGLVEHPLSLSLADLRKLPSRTQITRHDCVEGWSCIGEWTGVPLRIVLAMAKPKENARYAVFYCADPMDDSDDDGVADSNFYYESHDLIEATHPQTLLAYALNGRPLPVANGAPVRLRAERQLGYKQAKYVQRVELVESYAHIAGGKGGYWEDQGYNWYGGI
ncbi:MAG TPA: molybdopterin-binding protein [Rhizomicrobium sp.]|nr:molybdopterin-binding protein [Rhizomicrobium sp.]